MMRNKFEFPKVKSSSKCPEISSDSTRPSAASPPYTLLGSRAEVGIQSPSAYKAHVLGYDPLYKPLPTSGAEKGNPGNRKCSNKQTHGKTSSFFSKFSQ